MIVIIIARKVCIVHILDFPVCNKFNWIDVIGNDHVKNKRYKYKKKILLIEQRAG